MDINDLINAAGKDKQIDKEIIESLSFRNVLRMSSIEGSEKRMLFDLDVTNKLFFNSNPKIDKIISDYLNLSVSQEAPETKRSLISIIADIYKSPDIKNEMITNQK